MAEKKIITSQAELEAMYFLKSTKVPDQYIHGKGQNLDGQNIYQLCEGQKGAAVFSQTSGTDFILANGLIGHLELVKLVDVVNK